MAAPRCAMAWAPRVWRAGRTVRRAGGGQGEGGERAVATRVVGQWYYSGQVAGVRWASRLARQLEQAGHGVRPEILSRLTASSLALHCLTGVSTRHACNPAAAPLRPAAQPRRLPRRATAPAAPIWQRSVAPQARPVVRGTPMSARRRRDAGVERVALTTRGRRPAGLPPRRAGRARCRPAYAAPQPPHVWISALTCVSGRLPGTAPERRSTAHGNEAEMARIVVAPAVRGARRRVAQTWFTRR